MTPVRAPALQRSYDISRALTAEHGRTYYLGTRMLPADRREAVYALYGFARMVDDWVDVADTDVDDPSRAIDEIEVALMSALDDTRARGTLDVDTVDDRLLAVVDTITSFDIDRSLFTAFLTSMRMDVPGNPLFRNRYRTLDELSEYMFGSASVIGLQMLPILGTAAGVRIGDAEPTARALGDAFQLTNFLRDVGEDLDRDRIYLPLDELAAFGVDEETLRDARATGRAAPELQRGLAHLVAITRSVYRQAEPGVGMLAARSRPGIRAAFEIYRDILGEMEAVDFQVFDTRVRVGTAARLRRAAAAITAFAPDRAR